MLYRPITFSCSWVSVYNDIYNPLQQLLPIRLHSSLVWLTYFMTRFNLLCSNVKGNQFQSLRYQHSDWTYPVISSQWTVGQFILPPRSRSSTKPNTRVVSLVQRVPRADPRSHCWWVITPSGKGVVWQIITSFKALVTAKLTYFYFSGKFNNLKDKNSIRFRHKLSHTLSYF